MFVRRRRHLLIVMMTNKDITLDCMISCRQTDQYVYCALFCGDEVLTTVLLEHIVMTRNREVQYGLGRA